MIDSYTDERPTASSVNGGLRATPTTAELIPQVAALRYEADRLRAETVNLDRSFYAVNLDERTDHWQTRSVQSLLSELSENWGVGWSGIARMVGVSVPALRKWRLGEPAAPANRRG